MLKGSESRTCQSSGRWEPEVPVCKRKYAEKFVFACTLVDPCVCLLIYMYCIVCWLLFVYFLSVLYEQSNMKPESVLLTLLFCLTTCF